MPVHQLQNAVGARLHGQVHQVTDLREIGDRRDQLLPESLGLLVMNRKRKFPLPFADTAQ